MRVSTMTFRLTSACIGLACLVSFQDPHGTGRTGQGTASGQVPPATRDALSSQTLHFQRADRIVGTDLTDSSGASIGRIEDLILNADGSIGFVVVQTSIGSQSKLFPIAWSSLQFHSAGDPSAQGAGVQGGVLKANFTKDRLEMAPGFAAGQWPAEGSGTVFQEASAFWGRGAATTPPTRDETDSTGRPREATLKNPSWWRSSTLGTSVVTDASGNPIGTLDQVVADPGSGRIAYASLKLTGGNVIAVPWTLFQTTPDRRNQFRLDVPQDRLMKAPQFQTGDANWKSMSDPAWVGQVYGYYSVQPYWKGRSSATSAPAGTSQAPDKTQPPPKTPKSPGGG